MTQLKEEVRTKEVPMHMPKEHERYELMVGEDIIPLDGDPRKVSTTYAVSFEPGKRLFDTPAMPFDRFSNSMLAMAEFSSIKLTCPDDAPDYHALVFFRQWLERFFKIEFDGTLKWVAAAGDITFDKLRDFYENWDLKNNDRIVQNGVDIRRYVLAREGHLYIFGAKDTRAHGILVYPNWCDIETEPASESEAESDTEEHFGEREFEVQRIVLSMKALRHPISTYDLTVVADSAGVVVRNEAVRAKMESRNSGDVIFVRVEREPWKAYKSGKEVEVNKLVDMVTV